MLLHATARTQVCLAVLFAVALPAEWRKHCVLCCGQADFGGATTGGSAGGTCARVFRALQPTRQRHTHCMRAASPATGRRAGREGRGCCVHRRVGINGAEGGGGGAEEAVCGLPGEQPAGVLLCLLMEMEDSGLSRHGSSLTPRCYELVSRVCQHSIEVGKPGQTSCAELHFVMCAAAQVPGRRSERATSLALRNAVDSVYSVNQGQDRTAQISLLCRCTRISWQRRAGGRWSRQNYKPYRLTEECDELPHLCR